MRLSEKTCLGIAAPQRTGLAMTINFLGFPFSVFSGFRGFSSSALPFSVFRVTRMLRPRAVRASAVDERLLRALRTNGVTGLVVNSLSFSIFLPAVA